MYYLDTFLFYSIIILPIYIVGRLIYLKGANKKFDSIKEILLCVLAVYSIDLLIMLLASDHNTLPIFDISLPSMANINFMPFRTITSYSLETHNVDIIMNNILGNILIFMPIGFLLPAIWPEYRKFKMFALTAIRIPFSIEILQLFFNRSVDIDDIILNFTGMVLGWIILIIIVKIFGRVD